MFADVIVDINHCEVDKIFEYRVDELPVKIGSRLRVPFGKKTIEGIVIRLKENSEYQTDKIKSAISLLEEIPALTPETLNLSEYISKTCYCTRASSLRLFLPSEMRKGRVKEKFERFVEITSLNTIDSDISSLKKNAKNQRDLLYFLIENGKSKASILSEYFSYSVVKSLTEKGLITITEEKLFRSPYKDIKQTDKNVILTNAQKEAVEGINSTDKRTTLLYGVTGSGKTEVYLSLINDTVKSGKTAIMLVPEIALTPQMLKQIRGRFGDYAAILHSGLSAGERFDEWWRIRSGEAKIVIGARSAIFAPVENLGLIIIDEEHDGSYFSESNPRYNTIDVATYRAEYFNAKLILGSATPSIESYQKALIGNYNLQILTDRINKKPLPRVEVCDMRLEVRRGNNSPFSSALKNEIETCLKHGNQAMLFLNQRGYSKTVICTECGHVQKCESCDISLTYHKEDESLLCHYCGSKYKMISACTECGSPYLRHGGAGTERIVAELKKIFPYARILRMDRDTTQTKEGHFSILEKFSNKEADVLVGTQMIAKGHDFPSVTLVGILDADMGLHFSDYRSGERTFQLITQVAGRCGRAEEQGKVILQTYCPDNPVLRRAINYDYQGFYEHEVSVRKATGFPPFSCIVRILLADTCEDRGLEILQKLYYEVEQIYKNNLDDFFFFGCMKAPLKRLENKFRYQILMRIKPQSYFITDSIFEIIKRFNCKNTMVSLEINPSNLN